MIKTADIKLICWLSWLRFNQSESVHLGVDHMLEEYQQFSLPNILS